MDNIANMLTSIRNAQAVQKETVSVPYSKFRMSVIETISKGGFVGPVTKKGRKNKVINIALKYDEYGKPVIKELKRVSKLSCRIYKGYKDVRAVQRGYGMQVLSTPKGVISDKEARDKKVGGEVVCEIS